MGLRGLASWTLAAVLAVCVGAGTARAQALPSYVQIDGRYYAAGAETMLIFPELRAVVVTDALAQNCRRASGAPITAAGMVLYYGPSVLALQVSGPIRLHFTHHRIVEVWTVDRDVVCNGEVAAPTPPVVVNPDQVFGDGFED